jgi:hypothetical protein
MPVSLPYLASNKNVAVLFEKIRNAKAPDKFTHAFLTTTIGLKGTNDRQLIPLLRYMGFIDQSGTPSNSYSLLKGHNPGSAIAEGMRNAYGPLFDADVQAHKLPADRLKALISQVAGADADAASRIASTFTALAKLADFERELTSTAEIPPPEPARNDVRNDDQVPRSSNLRPEFHYNLQIHLPANGDEETYLNIFNAIRKTFQ